MPPPPDRLARSVVLALWLVVVVSLASAGFLAVTQAPSGDEAHTLSQTRDPGLATLRETVARSEDRSPPAYYLLAWTVGRGPGDPLDVLRALSVAGWAAAAWCLARITAGRGGGPAASAVTGILPSASGLLSQAMVARPYGLAVGLLGGALLVWHRSLAPGERTGSGASANRRAAALGLFLAVALVLHYALLTAVTCLLVAELVARRRDRVRSGAFLAAIACSSLPLLLLAGSIRRSVAVVRSLPHAVGPWSAPAFYASVLRPAAPALVVGVVVVAVGWLLAGRPHRSGLVALARLRAHRPALALAVLLATTVPLQVAVVTALTSGAYLHRYAMAGLAGLALLAGYGTSRLARDDRQGAVGAAVVAVAVLACVPLAVTSARREAPSDRRVDVLAGELGLPRTRLPLAVRDPYVATLLERSPAAGPPGRVRLAGPTTDVGVRIVLDLSERVAPGRVGERWVLVATPTDLAGLAERGRVRVVERLGSAQLRTASSERRLTSAVVVLGPG